MITIGTTFEHHTCPKCKNSSVALIRTEIYDYGSRIHKVVMDTCPKCGVKLSKHKEFDRKLTDAEVDKLYPNGKTKPQVNEI